MGIEKREGHVVNQIVDELLADPKVRDLERNTIKKYIYIILNDLGKQGKVKKGSNKRYIIDDKQKSRIKELFIIKHHSRPSLTISDEELNKLYYETYNAAVSDESYNEMYSEVVFDSLGEVIDIEGSTVIDAGFDPEAIDSPYVIPTYTPEEIKFVTIKMQLLKTINMKLDVLIYLLTGRRIDEKKFRKTYLDFIRLVSKFPYPEVLVDKSSELSDLDEFWIPQVSNDTDDGGIIGAYLNNLVREAEDEIASLTKNLRKACLNEIPKVVDQAVKDAFHELTRELVPSNRSQSPAQQS